VNTHRAFRAIRKALQWPAAVLRRAQRGPAEPPPALKPGLGESFPERCTELRSQGSFLSSLKQAFTEDFDKEVVRGHFDVGSPPDAHRYYLPGNGKTAKAR